MHQKLLHRLVEESKVEGCILRGFIRVRVLVNILKPLLTGCWIPRVNKAKVWVVFKYEKLQGFCYNCGILGHEKMSCKRNKVMSVLCKEIPRYGANLGVMIAKPFSVLENDFERWRRNEQSFHGSRSSLVGESSSSIRKESTEDVGKNQSKTVLEDKDESTELQAARKKVEVTSKRAQG